jgi:hypothetical protein
MIPEDRRLGRFRRKPKSSRFLFYTERAAVILPGISEIFPLPRLWRPCAEWHPCTLAAPSPPSLRPLTRAQRPLVANAGPRRRRRAFVASMVRAATTPGLLLALLAFLLALAIPRSAQARVGLAEWRIELPGGLVVCHGDEAPDACGSVCIYDPRTQALTVADVDEYKIYDDAVVGVTTHGDYFLVDEATRAVERFSHHEDLDRALSLRGSTELGRFAKTAMVYGGYSLAPLAFFYTLFALLARKLRTELPVARRLEVYACASAVAPLLGALGFVVIHYLDQDWMGFAGLENGGMLPYFLLIRGIPALIGVGIAAALAIPATIALVHLAPKLRVPPRWTWLVSYAVCHLVVLRFTVGAYILYFNPYWRGGF